MSKNIDFMLIAGTTIVCGVLGGIGAVFVGAWSTGVVLQQFMVLGIILGAIVGLGLGIVLMKALDKKRE